MLLIILPEGPVLAVRATQNGKPYPYITIERGVNGSHYFWQVDTNNDHDFPNQYDIIACNAMLIVGKHYNASVTRILQLPEIQESSLLNDIMVVSNIDKVFDCEATQVDNVFVINKINEPQ